MSSTKFVFWANRKKTRWQPLPLIGWDIFDFSSETAERNLTKLDRKQDLKVLYQVCVFWADRKNKMAALASDWLRHFLLLLWNRWTACNETWQEERSQRPQPSLCFFGWSEKQDGGPGQSVKKVAHCTQVHEMWPFGPLVLNISCSWNFTQIKNIVKIYLIFPFANETIKINTQNLNAQRFIKRIFCGIAKQFLLIEWCCPSLSVFPSVWRQDFV